MDLRRELLLAVGGLIVLNLLLAFGAIGLFVRMGPAIERILQENVYSITAAEEILAELARSGNDALPAEARTRIREAFQKAEQNVTEEEERPVLAHIARLLPPTLEGDLPARQQLLAELGRLIQINRAAMAEVDEEAQRLGKAGAWAAVLLGFSSFLLSLLILVLLQRRIVGPLLDLHAVLEGARQGDRLRRCRLSLAPREVVQVLDSVNWLLDERLGATSGSASPGASADGRAAANAP
ncbi:MAG: hypothetical protein RBU45_20090 [Myxococcota bacterium]|jgi:uncharacterized membrane protein|nr:hypothetical protein [Myxococcota bacterium]